MEQQTLTISQKLEAIYLVSRTAKLTYEEHAILQQYFEDIKKELKTSEEE